MQLFLTSEDDTAAWLVCEGEISQSSFPSNHANPLEELLGDACYQRCAIIDLGPASFIDSSGIGWLVTCHNRFVAAGGKLILHSVPPMIDQVLRLLRLQTVLFLKRDRAAALAAAAGGK
jgi:anti-anti-sigma factor